MAITLRKVITLVIAAALVALPACGGGDDNGGVSSQQVELQAFDFYFQETTLLLGLGARVTVDFVNAGENTHSFTVPDLDIDVAAASGETTEIKFSLPDEPGLVDFFCKYHPDDMNGTITIGGGELDQEEELEEDE